MATIINNGETALESDVLAPSPYIYVADPLKGKPLDGAKLYFGIAGRDPQVVANQKKVYMLQENGSAVAIPQPVITGAGGIPMYNEMVAALAVDGAFSYKVLDKNDAQRYYLPKVTTPNLLGYSGVVAEEAKKYTGTSLITYDQIEASTATFYASAAGVVAPFNGQFMRKDIDYSVTSSTQITLISTYPLNTVILGRQMDPTGAIVSVSGTVTNLVVIDTMVEAKTVDLELGQTVTLNGENVIADGLGGNRYIVVAGGTGTADDENFVNLNNGLQLQLIQNNTIFRKHALRSTTATISSGDLTIDMDRSSEQVVTLTENIGDVLFINVNARSGITNTVTLKVKQSAGTLYDITWPARIKWAGGTSPSVTQTVDREDIFGFITYNGGATWYGAVMGQDYAV